MQDGPPPPDAPAFGEQPIEARAILGYVAGMSSESPHILVVDDDARLRRLLARYLADHGYLVATAENAADARDKLGSFAFDMIVLDLMMPGEGGLSFAADLRRRSGVPILMLTAMGEPGDRIGGLEAGADDYLVKPFEPRELLLRIGNILRRAPQTNVFPTQVRMGDMVFDLEREELRHHDAPVRLTSIETALLAALGAAAGSGDEPRGADRPDGRRRWRPRRRRAGNAIAPEDRARSTRPPLSADGARQGIRAETGLRPRC